MFGTNIAPPESILILGLGGVGYYLAKRLVHEEYAVTIIETDPKIVRQADGQIDARLIIGSALSIKCWREAEAEKMDYMIAVTNNDAVNMMASMIADRFGIKRKIARVRSLEFGTQDSLLTATDLKLDLLIHPEELVSQEIVRLIQINSSHEIIDIAQGEIQLLATGINETSPMANRTLRDIAAMYDDFQFRVVAIARGITTIIPYGSHQILPNDQIFIMVAQENLPKLMEVTGVYQHQQQKVMLLGGGLVGSRVAALLEKSVSVKLIEKDEQSVTYLSIQKYYLLAIVIKVSFMFCAIAMLLIFMQIEFLGSVIFGLSLFLLVSSLLFSLWEVQLSTEAINIEIDQFQKKIGKKKV